MIKRFLTLREWTLPSLLAIGTLVFHLAYGVWFWTASPTNAPKTGLKLAGEEFLASIPGWNTDYEADAACYNRAAVEVLRTGVPRTRSGLFFEHAPLYAYFLAGCYQIGGFRMLAFAVPQAVLAAMICLLIGLTAARLAPRHHTLAGAAAALLMLINVRHAAYVGYANPTMLLLFFFSLAIWGRARFPDSAKGHGIFFGSLMLAVYTQAAFFIIALAIVVWAVAMFWRSKRLPFLVGAILLAACAVSKPFIALVVDRSHETYLSEAPTFVLWEANNPYYESMTVFSLWERRPVNPWTHWKMSQAEDRRYQEYLERGGGNKTQAALLWIRENPGQYLKLCAIRFVAELGPITGQMSPLNKKISTLLWLLIFPAGFLGLWRLRASPFGWLALAIILFQVGFETLVMAGWQPRYRLPVDLMLIAAAGVVYADWAGRWLLKTPAPAGPA